MVSALWTHLDSRLRGNDSVSCGEGFVVAHESLCFSVGARRQSKQCGKVGQPRQEGFVGGDAKKKPPEGG